MSALSPCHHFNQGQCQSCRHLPQPLAQQLAVKTAVLQQLLHPFVADPAAIFKEPIFGAACGFRNKAKMVALGAAHAPVLGIVSPSGEAVSLW
ncbi:MAG: 23S rRNA (uracil(747)-C(5))-methyltransferase RlmC, partial [Shewanella sp.]